MTAPAVTNKSDNGDSDSSSKDNNKNNINEPMNPPSSPVTHHDEEYKFEKEEEVKTFIGILTSSRSNLEQIDSSNNQMNDEPHKSTDLLSTREKANSTQTT